MYVPVGIRTHASVALGGNFLLALSSVALLAVAARALLARVAGWRASLWLLFPCLACVCALVCLYSGLWFETLFVVPDALAKYAGVELVPDNTFLGPAGEGAYQGLRGLSARCAAKHPGFPSGWKERTDPETGKELCCNHGKMYGGCVPLSADAATPDTVITRKPHVVTKT